MITIEAGTDELPCNVEDRVVTVTINKPDKRNALGDSFTPALGDMLLALEADARVGCVLITGARNAICAGGDVCEMGSMAQHTEGRPRTLDECVLDLTRKQGTLTLQLVKKNLNRSAMLGLRESLAMEAQRLLRCSQTDDAASSNQGVSGEAQARVPFSMTAVAHCL